MQGTVGLINMVRTSVKKIYIYIYISCLFKSSARTCRYPKMPPLLLSFNCLTRLPILPLFTVSNSFTNFTWSTSLTGYTWPPVILIWLFFLLMFYPYYWFYLFYWFGPFTGYTFYYCFFFFFQFYYFCLFIGLSC